MFKVSPTSFQTFIDTPICVLVDRVQYSTFHIPNVFCDGHLKIISCVGIVRRHWVFDRTTENRNCLITLYKKTSLFTKPLNVMIKVKVLCNRPEGPEGVVVYLYSFLTSALEGVGVQHHAPVALPPGMTRYPLYMRLCGPHDRSGRVRKISPHRGFFISKFVHSSIYNLPKRRRIRSPECPARSQSLYRLSYPGSLYKTVLIKIWQMSVLLIFM
jgi:hypothetical protein